ncbi:No apical meristem (NAM) protein [Corchorus olitorius]|uniref:No apical meristem (NAM) protein n=1 Tax=Corchorus olitorius TaxID=93759 RepID=A0A1R3KG16_9ROSI|nr:No apical meristem (NAM) protein [Corchorus olitorius]
MFDYDLRNLPVGFKFEPTDQEIVKSYVRPAIEKDHKSMISGQNQNQKKKKRKNLNSENKKKGYFQRRAGCGWWHDGTGAKGIRDCDGNLLGHRKYLTYRKDDDPEGSSGWVMYEDSAEGLNTTAAICKIQFKAASAKINNNKRQGDQTSVNSTPHKKPRVEDKGSHSHDNDQTKGNCDCDDDSDDIDVFAGLALAVIEPLDNLGSDQSNGGDGLGDSLKGLSSTEVHNVVGWPDFYFKFVLKLEHNLWRSRDEGPNKYQEYWGYVDREMRITDKVDSWVDFAMRKEVKHLHLDFKGCGDSEPNAYSLPHVVFEQSIFEGLEVGCFLSTLTFKNPSIKSLIVELEHNSQRLQISCPNLVSLRLVGLIQLVDLLDASSLAVSSIFFISFDSKCALSRHLDIRRLFQKLSHSTDDHTMYLVYTGIYYMAAKQSASVWTS